MHFFGELAAGTYGPSDLDTAGWIASVQAGRAGTWINLRPWEFHTLGEAAGTLGSTGQAALFEQAVLDGLNTLDNSSPGTVYSDLLGVAGGVRGLAFAGTTTFTAIDSPNHSGINGIATLQALADYLAGQQNADGSWYWHSRLDLLGGATESDKDVQTTAYAALALQQANLALPAPPSYSNQVGLGQSWLRTMQFSSGGFEGYRALTVR